jgi:hypothetical protein
MCADLMSSCFFFLIPTLFSLSNAFFSSFLLLYMKGGEVSRAIIELMDLFSL